MLRCVITAILHGLFILKLGPIWGSGLPVRNTGMTLHCPSFRDWRPDFVLGAFFVAVGRVSDTKRLKSTLIADRVEFCP